MVHAPPTRSLLMALLLCACAPTSAAPAIPERGPASPHVAEPPIRPLSSTLTADPGPPAAAPAPHDHHGHHHHAAPDATDGGAP